jgi:hypothetical protein
MSHPAARRGRVDLGAACARLVATGFVVPLLLYVGLVALLGFWGISIDDGGLILAQAHRILLGEIPHRDFITPRPTGSAFLHVVDYLLPVPLELSSKLITIAELVVAGMVWSLFVFGKRLSHLGFAETCGAVICVLVGIGQFPIIPFYTIDGLLFVGVGFLFLQRSLRTPGTWRLVVAFAAFGVAATTKQSFWFAPFLALAWLLAARCRSRVSRAELLRGVTVAVASCAVAPALYVGYVVAGGGWSEMWSELTGTTAVYGANLVSEFTAPSLRDDLVPLLVAVGMLLPVAWNARQLGRRIGTGVTALELAARVGATGLFVATALSDDLVIVGNWSQRLFWCVCLVAVMRSVARRSLDATGVVVAATAWMVSLSWGAPAPVLAAGVCLIYLLDATWRGTRPITGRRLRRLAAVAAAVPLLVIVRTFLQERTSADYGVPRSTETFTLGGNLADVRTNAETATYLRDVAMCTARYPARWAAVVPEGALADAVFGLRNPFPIDWFWAPDYSGAGGRQRLLDAASARPTPVTSRPSSRIPA